MNAAQGNAPIISMTNCARGFSNMLRVAIKRQEGIDSGGYLRAIAIVDRSGKSLNITCCRQFLSFLENKLQFCRLPPIPIPPAIPTESYFITTITLNLRNVGHLLSLDEIHLLLLLFVFAEKKYRSGTTHHYPEEPPPCADTFWSILSTRRVLQQRKNIVHG